MLNDRERRTLERIEQHLRTSDPEFVRQFHTAAASYRAASARPRILLVVGLLLMVLGTALVAPPLAVLGMGVSLGALVLAHQRNGSAGFSPA
ncbi:MAG: DUF3040 domain-containing protein [Pseudonocardiales bacterium]|nr:DUF3040 domain-containing protein [Pseudonocardiales bacterium]